MKKTLFFCVLACLFSLQRLFASHFMGVEMSYESLGGCDYRLYHTVYIDCQGAAYQSILPPYIGNPTPVPTLNFTGVGCTVSGINPVWVCYDAADVTPICPGVVTSCIGNNMAGPNGLAAYRFYADISLCGLACSEVIVSWGSCCRNYAITSGASGEGIYNEMTIPLTISNSSPRFMTPPAAFLAAGQSFLFQQAAFDADGDSLVYSLVPCLSNAGQILTYNAGYSPSAPLGTTWSCSIDPQTGDLSITPTGGGSVAIGVLGVQVEEYRNGVLIGHSNRDAQITVVNLGGGGGNTEPSATMSNVNGVGFQNPPLHLQTKAGHAITFDIDVTDPNPGQLLAFTANITTLFPTATLTANGNTSPMTMTFSWTPDSSYRGKILPLLINIFDNFCTFNGHKYVFTNIEIDSSYVVAISTSSDCTVPTGALDVSVGGGYPPYTYSWNNGATTQDLVNVAAGAYTLAVTDASGTVWNNIFYINVLGLSSILNATSPNCNMADGALGIDMSGGISPYTYTWSNGQTGDTLNNLLVGGYSVDVYDALGCFYHTATMLNYAPLDSCFSRIEGILYLDANTNCIQDPLEVGISNVWIDIDPGGATFTDANGHYAFTVNDTGTYLIYPIVLNPNLVTSNCLPFNLSDTAYISALGIDSLHNDFPINYQSDMQVAIWQYGNNPGGLHGAYLYAHNTSYYLSNATLSYQHDSLYENLVFSIPPTTYDSLTYTATWDFTYFTPGSWRYISVTGNTSLLASIGDTTKSYISILPSVGDITPYNNQDTSICIIGAAYDPNFKEVSPQGQTIHGLIPANTQELEYTIHFQNTGNWQATYVILRDTIDVNHLDITSTEIQITSHPCIISVKNDSILVFTFNNINLPDSNTNEPASHGFVQYGIKLKPNLPLYTEIHNQASIYFDFNAPILTNATTNTLYNAMNLSVVTNTNICPDDSVLATVTQGRQPYQFDWSNGVQATNNTSGISHIPANFVTGTQNVTVSDYYGATVSHDFMLNVYPVANADFTYTPAGNNIYFNANAANNATYLWDFGNGQSSTAPFSTAYYPQNGTYTITLICTDMCGGADTSTQTITLTTSLSPTLFQQQVSLSPNPTAHITTLSFANAQKEAYTLTISDINGKVISVYEGIKNDKIAIDTDKMASGVYFWELTGSQFATGKLLIE